MSILNKLSNKGITYDQFTEEERKTYDEWQEKLETVTTLEQMDQFVQAQIKNYQKKLNEFRPASERDKDVWYKAIVHVLTMIDGFVNKDKRAELAIDNFIENINPNDFK